MNQIRTAADWHRRPRVPLAEELHTQLKLAAVAKGVPLGLFTDQIVILGLEQWKQQQESIAS